MALRCMHMGLAVPALSPQSRHCSLVSILHALRAAHLGSTARAKALRQSALGARSACALYIRM